MKEAAMENVYIGTVLLEDGQGNKGAMPCYATAHAAGADVALPCDVEIKAHSRAAWIDLLVGFEIPHGKVLMLQPRSSTSRKWGVTCDTGIIDSDYVNKPIHCALINYTDEDVVIEKGTRVVQLLCFDAQNVATWERKNVDRDSAAGSGSTGD